MYIKWVIIDKKLRKIKNLNFSSLEVQNLKFAQNQLSFALFHDGETMTFRVSAWYIHSKGGSLKNNSNQWFWIFKDLTDLCCVIPLKHHS